MLLWRLKSKQKKSMSKNIRKKIVILLQAQKATTLAFQVKTSNKFKIPKRSCRDQQTMTSRTEANKKKKKKEKKSSKI